MSDDHPHPLHDKLEPEARDCRTPADAALTSIAVSMKRIADALHGGYGHVGLETSIAFLEQSIRANSR